jgi:hypothetical protein
MRLLHPYILTWEEKTVGLAPLGIARNTSSWHCRFWGYRRALKGQSDLSPLLRLIMVVILERDKSMVGISGPGILINDLFTDFIANANHFKNPGQRSSISIRIRRMRGMLPQLGQGIRSSFGRPWQQPEQMWGKGFMAF